MPKRMDLFRYSRTLFATLTLLSLLALASAARAAPLQFGRAYQGRLPAPFFADHMVLQRDRPVAVWGEGAPASEVQLELRDPATGEVLAAASAEVGATGWRVDLPPLPTGGPFELSLRDSTGATRVIEDVLVGEVWLASGQSNIAAKRFPAEPMWNGAFLDATRSPWVRAYASGDQREGEGWRSVPSETAGWLATGLAKALEASEGAPIPVGIINFAVPGSSIRRWLGGNEAQDSGVFFRSWIEPIAPFAARGVFWWQGESDHQGRGATEYSQRLRELVRSWRAAFENEDLYFATVLIPTGRGVALEELVKAYPKNRMPKARTAGLMYDAYLNAQRDLPSVGVALSKDLPGGTHPPDREPYAARLVDLVRHDVYGEDLVYSGPVFSCMTRNGEDTRIRFVPGSAATLRPGGLDRVGRSVPIVQGFQIGVDADTRVWADARIEGDELVLSHPDVPSPGYVSYAWAANPRWANLFNGDGQAAAPFQASWPEHACAS